MKVGLASFLLKASVSLVIRLYGFNLLVDSRRNAILWTPLSSV